jgi:hypothetical protein
MKKWKDLSKYEQTHYGNGIGPAWWPPWLRNLITGFCSRFFLEASWQRHDHGYQWGGTEIDRINADGRFLIAMRRDVSRARWYLKPIAWVLCYSFYIAVRFGGCKSFNFYNND